MNNKKLLTHLKKLYDLPDMDEKENDSKSDSIFTDTPPPTANIPTQNTNIPAPVSTLPKPQKYYDHYNTGGMTSIGPTFGQPKTPSSANAGSLNSPSSRWKSQITKDTMKGLQNYNAPKVAGTKQADDLDKWMGAANEVVGGPKTDDGTAGLRQDNQGRYIIGMDSGHRPFTPLPSSLSADQKYEQRQRERLEVPTRPRNGTLGYSHPSHLIDKPEAVLPAEAAGSAALRGAWEVGKNVSRPGQAPFIRGVAKGLHPRALLNPLNLAIISALQDQYNKGQDGVAATNSYNYAVKDWERMGGSDSGHPKPVLEDYTHSYSVGRGGDILDSYSNYAQQGGLSGMGLRILQGSGLVLAPYQLTSMVNAANEPLKNLYASETDRVQKDPESLNRLAKALGQPLYDTKNMTKEEIEDAVVKLWAQENSKGTGDSPVDLVARLVARLGRPSPNKPPVPTYAPSTTDRSPLMR